MARGKNRVRFSKLYTWAGCFRPPSPLERQQSMSVGGPGFSRVVFCNKSEMHLQKPFRYKSNYVSTTKYNVLTFVPKALFEQFRRVANLYFLLAAILALTPVSPVTAASLIAPLVFVVGVSMCKEALEDWRRFSQVNFLVHLPLITT
jgi:phospholipid-translocating ATPase